MKPKRKTENEKWEDWQGGDGSDTVIQSAQTEQRDTATQPENWEQLSEAQQDKWMRDTATQPQLADMLEKSEELVGLISDGPGGSWRYERLLDRMQAHAERLAEAMKGAIAALSQSVQFSDGKGGAFKIIQGDCVLARKFLSDALAQWEGEQK